MSILIDLLYDGVKEILIQSKASKIEKKRIVDALERAIANTEFHIDTTRESGIDKASIELFNIWNELATEVEPFDGARADIFREKSYYWKNPELRLSQREKGQIRKSLETRLEKVKLDYWKLKTLWK